MSVIHVAERQTVGYLYSPARPIVTSHWGRVPVPEPSPTLVMREDDDFWKYSAEGWETDKKNHKSESTTINKPYSMNNPKLIAHLCRSSFQSNLPDNHRCRMEPPLCSYLLFGRDSVHKGIDRWWSHTLLCDFVHCSGLRDRGRKLLRFGSHTLQCIDTEPVMLLRVPVLLTTSWSMGGTRNISCGWCFPCVLMDLW